MIIFLRYSLRVLFTFAELTENDHSFEQFNAAPSITDSFDHFQFVYNPFGYAVMPFFTESINYGIIVLSEPINELFQFSNVSFFVYPFF